MNEENLFNFLCDIYLEDRVVCLQINSARKV